MGEGLIFSAVSDVGLVRDKNEDAFGVFAPSGRLLPASGTTGRGDDLIVVVSDGVGGQEEGEVASSSVVASVGAGLGQLSASGRNPMDKEIPDCIREMTTGLNAHIRAFAEHRGQQKKRMAATLTAGWLSRGHLLVLHVGDSRLYRWRDGQLEQLTVDDTEAGEGLASGQLTEEEARNHPKSHVLKRAIGIKPSVFEVQVQQLEVRDGDSYLLCSDGLTDGLSNSQLAGAFKKVDSTPLSEFNDKLVEAANRNSGKDNVTVALITVESGWNKAALSRNSIGRSVMKEGKSWKTPLVMLAITLLCFSFLAWGIWTERQARDMQSSQMKKDVLRLEAAISELGNQTSIAARQREMALSANIQATAERVNSLRELLANWSVDLQATNEQQAETIRLKFDQITNQIDELQQSANSDLVYLRKWLAELQTEMGRLSGSVDSLSEAVAEQEADSIPTEPTPWWPEE